MACAMVAAAVEQTGLPSDLGAKRTGRHSPVCAFFLVLSHRSSPPSRRRRGTPLTLPLQAISITCAAVCDQLVATTVDSCTIARTWMAAPTRCRPQPAAPFPAPVFPAARGASPTRPRSCATQPGWGCGRAERRLAGPGLGDTTVEWTSTWAVGQPWACLADPPSTAVGGGRERLVMRRT